MNILLSNDDGILAEGIFALYEALKPLGNITVVAPSHERSASGHGLTLHKPLRIHEVKENFFSVSGSPADCVYLATRQILKSKPDLIVSGINKGPNLGFDIFYSGTVAAAREGAIFGIKSLSVSLFYTLKTKTSPQWETASFFAKKIIPHIMEFDYKPNELVFNLNVPNVEKQKVKGLMITSQGFRNYSNKVQVGTDPRDRKYFWIGGAYEGFIKKERSDCQAIDENYASLTPLKIDTTNYEILDKLREWEKI